MMFMLHGKSPVAWAFIFEVARLLQLGAIMLTVRPIFQIKYLERAIGLILVSPICRKPTWSEWIYNKVCILALLRYSVKPATGLIAICVTQKMSCIVVLCWD